MAIDGQELLAPKRAVVPAQKSGRTRSARKWAAGEGAGRGPRTLERAEPSAAGLID